MPKRRCSTATASPNTSSAAPSEPRASTARSQAVGHHRWNESSARRSPTQWTLGG